MPLNLWYVIPWEIVVLYEQSNIEHTHTSLTFFKKSKINLPTNQGTSEGPETLALEYSTRQIWIWLVQSFFWQYLERYFEKEIIMDDTKMNYRDLDSPHWELAARCLGFVVAFLVHWQIDFFVCILTWRAIQPYSYFCKKWNLLRQHLFLFSSLEELSCRIFSGRALVLTFWFGMRIFLSSFLCHISTV